MRGVIRVAKEALFPKIAHFDGKTIENITDGKKAKRDRFAVSASIYGDIKLLGISAMEHGTGAAQCDALAKVLENYGMCDVRGLCFDTTASNTGRHSGTNISLAKDRILFYWSLPLEGIFTSLISNISGSKSTQAKQQLLLELTLMYLSPEMVFSNLSSRLYFSCSFHGKGYLLSEDSYIRQTPDL